MKQSFYVLLVGAFSALILVSCAFVAEAKDISIRVIDQKEITQPNSVSVSKNENIGNMVTKTEQWAIASALQNEENIQYYAYMDIKIAEEDVKPIILKARNEIIFRYSWVSDEVNGRVLDKDGNIKEELPHFSEIFPEDWDVPIVNSQVDIDYYSR